MSSEINTHNLFHILHPFWIHHTKNWILLSKQYEHLQTAMKHYTKFLWSVIKEGEVNISHTLHSSWIHHNSKKNNWILLSWNYAHLQMTMKQCTKSSWRRSEHQVFHTLHPLWIHCNSEIQLDPPFPAICTSTNDNKAIKSFKSLQLAI
jgi:hypothetical protein